jgi:hypothetical protein
VADIQPLTVRLDEAPGADGEGLGVLEHARVHCVRGLLHDRRERDAVLRQHLRVDLDVSLVEPLAVDHHLRYAGHAQEAAPDLPVGDRRHVDQGQLVRREPDLHDPGGGGEGRHHERRARPGRQLGRDSGEALLDELPRAVEVGPALEVELDRGDLLDGVRAHLVEALDAVERVLDRNRDQLLDLDRRVPGRERLHLDDRRRELGKDVQRRVTRREEPEHQGGGGAEDREPAEAQAPCDDPPHYPVTLRLMGAG